MHDDYLPFTQNTGMNTLARQNSSVEPTKPKIFRPTPHMIVWLDTALRLTTDNVSDIAEECGIDRSAWYDWRQKDDFRIWFKTEWDKRLAGESWKLDVIGLKKAKQDHRYWESMQQRVGNITKTGDSVGIAMTDGKNIMQIKVTRG